MKAILIAMWRLFEGLFFYPIMIGLFIWVWVTGKHWLWGLAIIIAILVFDPMWRLLAGNVWKMLNQRKTDP